MTGAGPAVLATGTVSLDTVEASGRTERDVLGGSAPYFGASARLHARVALVGVVGDDFPDAMLGPLRDAGVNVRGISVHPGKTFRWHARYRDKWERETVGSNRPEALAVAPSVPEDAKGPDALFLGSTDPAVQASVLMSAGAPKLTVLDTMTHWIHDRRDEFDMLARSSDVVLLNEEEAKALGGGDYQAGIRPILEEGCSWVVVKRGAEGAIAFGHDRAVAVSAPRPSAVVDPTGAGDAFAGGLVASLAASWPDRLGIDEAMSLAAAMGSLAVESFSIDRLLAATHAGVRGRTREVRVRVRRHPVGS